MIYHCSIYGLGTTLNLTVLQLNTYLVVEYRLILIIDVSFHGAVYNKCVPDLRESSIC